MKIVCLFRLTLTFVGHSSATVKRDWSFAKAFLHRELKGGVP